MGAVFLPDGGREARTPGTLRGRLSAAAGRPPDPKDNKTAAEPRTMKQSGALRYG